MTNYRILIEEYNGGGKRYSCQKKVEGVWATCEEIIYGKPFKAYFSAEEPAREYLRKEWEKEVKCTAVIELNFDAK